MERPVLALTMGDPAGIGPEISLKALANPQVYQEAKPFIVGDLSILAKAARFSGMDVHLRSIASPTDAVYQYGTVDVLNMGIVPEDELELGKVQALGGKAAFAYIRRAIELAMAKDVDGVVTAPINKKSLQAAEIPYIGHTEMFADLTGAKEEMTMFSILDLKIFFLTRHVSLAEACRMITKERVLDGIVKSTHALKQLGLAHPHLAVAGLNPHAGENGLFGREEVEAITPAVEAAQEQGLHVTGPVPADSVFHMARKGRFDAVLSLYHDQGHIAAKMMDFERTVSVTLGLSILRTSVDHGTAFDIAGQGLASPVSMIEAVRVAAQYARQGIRLE